MSLQQGINNNTLPSQRQLIKPPFPPTIEPKDLIKKTRDGVYTRTPNAFIIYRKLFIETARREGHFLPMTVISAMSSQSWEREPEIVKNEYKRIAKATFNYRKELIPKTKQRRKREKWNIVSFEKGSIMKESGNNESLQREQTPTPFSSPYSKSDCNLIQEKILPAPEISIENTFSNFNTENLIEFQNYYANPELPINEINNFNSSGQQFEFNLNISPEEFFESQIQNGTQNYQQLELEMIEQQQPQLCINNLGIPEFMTTGFNNTDYYFSSDISYEHFNEDLSVNIPQSFSEIGFDCAFVS